MRNDIPEQIVCSAIWFDNDLIYVHQPFNIKTGFVTCGLRHHNCIKIFSMIIGDSHKKRIKFLNRSVQGFLTNKNNFVDRKQAAKIAWEQKQIIKPVIELDSSDIW